MTPPPHPVLRNIWTAPYENHSIQDKALRFPQQAACKSLISLRSSLGDQFKESPNIIYHVSKNTFVKAFQ